jgi:hypothetical protein
MPTDRELDQIIDAALPSYSATEPQPGFEHRILSRTLTAPRSQNRFAWAWALAVPAAACLLALLFVAGRHDSHRVMLKATSIPAPATAETSRRETPVISSLPSLRNASIFHKLPTRPSTAQEMLPKEEVFPSPSPLTAEERAAIALVRDPAPPIPRQTDTAAGVEIDPIHIAELQIKPIAPPDDLSAALAIDSSPKAQQP